MDKLYWIVAEEGSKTLFENKYQGRTRGAARKHLEEQLGRASLTGLVFTITEIPVPLIEKIVNDTLQKLGIKPTLNGSKSPVTKAQTAKAETKGSAATKPEASDDPPPSGATRQSEYDWDAIKACYMEGRGPKDVAAIMNVPPNTLKGRITREGWAKERSRQQ